MPKVTRPSKLLDGSSDFVLTYEDKDGDWMLVGDVPWGYVISIRFSVYVICDAINYGFSTYLMVDLL